MKNASRKMNVVSSTGLRSGIALLVTVGIIALISIVVLAGVELQDRARAQTASSQKFSQSQAMLKSFEIFLVQQTSKVTSAETLDALIVSIPALADEEGLLELDVQINSLQGKININAIFDEDNKTISPAYETLFMRIFEKYQLKNPALLLALIADTIDVDTLDRDVNSELVNLYGDFSQGSIFSKDHLKKIISYYDVIAQDDTVYDIPWEKLFYFGILNEKGILDCNYMSSELAVYTGLELQNIEDSLSRLTCDDIPADKNETKHDFMMQEFSKSLPYYIEVLAEYRVFNKIEGSLSFRFDLKTKGLSHIRTY